MIDMKQVSFDVPAQIVQFVMVNDDRSEQIRDAMMVYPYIKNGTISHGKAAEMLGMNKLDLISLYSSMGVDYFDLSEAEFKDELSTYSKLTQKKRPIGMYRGQDLYDDDWNFDEDNEIIAKMFEGDSNEDWQ